jgi:outer membrane protein assembly factor BamD (BamD/ComL family)
LHTDKWEQAISAYSQFASLFPKHQQAQNAQLNIAEIYCQKDKWELALTAFQGFLEKYPRHQIGDAVSFRIADIYKFKLKDETKATGLYQNLINSYPNSSWAALAKQRLTQPNQGETQHEK